MSLSINFDYDGFIRYYKNRANYFIDPNPPIYKYYHAGIHNSIKSGKYIISHNTKLFIDIVKHKKYDEIYFTIYDPNDPHMLDNHYHFGIKENFVHKINTNNISTNVVFFHKTTQVIDSLGNLKNKIHSNCYFHKTQMITDISNIKCLESSRHKMSYMLNGQSIESLIIEDIIKRPFISTPIPPPIASSVAKLNPGGGRNKSIKRKQKVLYNMSTGSLRSPSAIYSDASNSRSSSSTSYNRTKRTAKRETRKYHKSLYNGKHGKYRRTRRRI